MNPETLTLANQLDLRRKELTKHYQQVLADNSSQPIVGNSYLSPKVTSWRGSPRMIVVPGTLDNSRVEGINLFQDLLPIPFNDFISMYLKRVQAEIDLLTNQLNSL